MKLGCNQPIGPLALADMIGLDVCLAVMEVYLKEFGDSKYRPALLREMVAAGRLGRKTGQVLHLLNRAFQVLCATAAAASRLRLQQETCHANRPSQPSARGLLL
jgi:3-hydroxyacyl-CoA dehydrogenase